jgi:nuclear pore complex protein Nup54
MKWVQLLRNKGYSVRAEEESLRSRLEAIERELSRSAVFRGRLLEMSTQVRSLHDSSLQGQAHASEGLRLSEGQLRAVYQGLEGQQNGVRQLMELVKRDGKDVDLMMGGYHASSRR